MVSIKCNNDGLLENIRLSKSGRFLLSFWVQYTPSVLFLKSFQVPQYFLCMPLRFYVNIDLFDRSRGIDQE